MQKRAGRGVARVFTFYFRGLGAIADPLGGFGASMHLDACQDLLSSRVITGNEEAMC